MSIRVYTKCAECLRFATDHPSFMSDRFLKVRVAGGKQRHTTQAGRTLHKLATRKAAGEIRERVK